MDVRQSEIGGTAVEKGPDRRLDGVSDDELLFLFSYDADQRRRTEPWSAALDTPGEETALDTEPGPVLGVEVNTRSAVPDLDSEALPASADPPPAVSQDQAPQEPSLERAILRLGAEPVVVSVRPDPQPPWVPDAYWPRPADDRPAPTDDRPAPAVDRPGQAREEPSPDEARASFELARWVEAVQPDYLGPVDTQAQPAAGPAVLRVQPPAIRTSRPRRDNSRSATSTDAPKTEADPVSRPLVMRFAARARPGDERTRAVDDRPRRTMSIRRDPIRRAGPFRWRRMLACAVVSGGLGSAALLLIHWMS